MRFGLWQIGTVNGKWNEQPGSGVAKRFQRREEPRESFRFVLFQQIHRVLELSEQTEKNVPAEQRECLRASFLFLASFLVLLFFPSSTVPQLVSFFFPLVIHLPCYNCISFANVISRFHTTFILFSFFFYFPFLPFSSPLVHPFPFRCFPPLLCLPLFLHLSRSHSYFSQTFGLGEELFFTFRRGQWTRLDASASHPRGESFIFIKELIFIQPSWIAFYSFTVPSSAYSTLFHFTTAAGCRLSSNTKRYTQALLFYNFYQKMLQFGWKIRTSRIILVKFV